MDSDSYEDKMRGGEYFHDLQILPRELLMKEAYAELVSIILDSHNT